MSEPGSTLITGLSASNGLALNRADLVAALKARKTASYTPFLAAPQHFGLPFNPLHVAMPALSSGRANTGFGDVATAKALLVDAIDAALLDAELDREALRAPRVQLYIAGQGVQSEFTEFAAYMRRNDREDLQLNPQIRKLHAYTHQEEGLTRALIEHYGLASPPISLTTASCSSFSGLYPAFNSIERGAVDLALVVSWQQVSLYNLIFMGGLNSLAQSLAQPFAPATEGVMLGCGTAAAVLESPAHLAARNGQGRMCIDGFSMAQGSGSGRSGQAFSPDFRVVAKTIEQALAKANCAPAEMSCVFAHGNGIRASDQAELMAIRKVWGEQGIPVVSYKAQFGYLVAASGLTDLAIAEHSLRSRRLPGFAAVAPLDLAAGVHLHNADTELELKSERILKISLGIEGSIAASVLRWAA